MASPPASTCVRQMRPSVVASPGTTHDLFNGDETVPGSVLVRSRPAAAALAVAVLAVSSSAPLIVFAAAPALAIAFWRNALAVGVLAPTAALRRRTELGELLRTHRRAAAASLVAGVAL